MIKIVADSTCDLDRDTCEKLGVEIVPLSIIFGKHVYADGKDLSNEEFYRLLENCKALPTTSAANPAQFDAVLRPLLKTCDDIIVITLSSGISATYQSACFAASDISEEHVFVVDSKSGSFGTALLIMEAVKYRDRGNFTAKGMAEQLREDAKNLRLFGVVDTLKYLHKGGRLSSGTAIIGGVLGICPILSLVDGEIAPVGKARGHKAASKFLAGQLAKHPIDCSKGVALGHACAAGRMEQYIETLTPLFKEAQLSRIKIGSVIGTHAGPGTIGLAFFEK